MVCAIVLCGFLMQYSLIVNILKDQIKNLNESFSTITKFPIATRNIYILPRNIPKNRLIIHNLMVIREARHKLYKIACDISDFFSFPALLTIFHCSCNCMNRTADMIYDIRQENALSKEIVAEIFSMTATYLMILLQFTPPRDATE
nr:PREDICTED: uncharacterized protein LOC105271258 [Fopius arisanus]